MSNHADNPATPPPAALPPVPDARGAVDVDELERKARAAGGPWWDVTRTEFEEAASPAAVLALIAEYRRVVAERDALRKAVEQIPGIIRNAGEPGPGGVDITSGIPVEVYVQLGRGEYEDDYVVARESAEYARDQAAMSVEHFTRNLLPSAAPPEPKGGA